MDLPLALYDLSRIICFIQADSQYATWAFGNLRNNRAQLAPRLHDTSADPLAEIEDEREATPVMGAVAGSDEASVLAVTTDVDRLFSPDGHVLGSDADECDYLLDDSRRRGVSSKHLRLFIDREEGQADNLTLQNLSKNNVRVISHEQRINENLTKGRQILLAGGSWSIFLHTTVPIVFKLVFPDRGEATADYIRNWSAFRAANIAASCAVPTLKSMSISRSADETPRVEGSPYKIDWTDEGLLGKGAFGAVRKALSRITNEMVAAKVFKYPGDIQSELGFLQTLRHKYIVVYKAFVQERGVDILIMEYLGCGTLEARITQGDKSIPVPRARLYWNQLARAVEFLHEQRVIHRDIKPPNVIFKSEDHLKLCDFGISKKLKSSDEVTGTQLGSPHYAAPEILNGEAYAFPSDIWSLGITVLDMFRLSPPKLESWRIAGPAGSASDRWLSAVEGAVRALPYDLGLLRGQLEKEQNLRPTAASLVAGLKEQPLSQARSSSAAVDEVGKLSKRILDPIPVEGRKKSHAAGA